jgi:hypothetical protein
LCVNGRLNLINNNIPAAHGDNIRNLTARAGHSSSRPLCQTGGPGNAFLHAGHD